MTATATYDLDILNDVIAEQMKTWHAPGLTIGVVKNGDVKVAAHGIANVETGVSVVPETLFQIGSISKIFTTTLIMTLVDEGKVALDTPVIQYVPDLPLADEEARNSITLRHLLTHHAGFYGDRFEDQGRGDDAIARAVAHFGDLPQQTRPGELWTYCNAGFDLAGRVAELVAGQGFEALMRERVFGPLGMERATYFADEAILHAVAAGHVKGDSGPEVAKPWPIPRRSGPAGAVTTNAAELLRFAQMHMNDGELAGKRVLSPESARAMREQTVEADAGRTWGIGWAVHEIAGKRFVEHGGQTNGFTARLMVLPAEQFAFTILTNGYYSAGHTKIAEAALERWFGIHEPEPPMIDLPDSTLAALAGKYTQRLGDYTLTAADGGFDVAVVRRNPFNGDETKGDAFRLKPISERIFAAVGGGNDGNLADFIFNPDGSVRFLRFGGRLAFPVK